MTGPASKPPKHWPAFASLQGYQRVWIRADVVAGLTVWAVLVPEALAYATIAGVPPVVGLYAAIPSLVLYAAAGSSRHLVVGPMSATAALSAASVAPFAGGDAALYVGLTAALAIVTGLAGLLFGLLRLGSIYGFAARADFAAAIAAMLGVLIFDTLPGLVIGIGVSMLLLLHRVSRPHVAGLAKRDGAWLDIERHDDLLADPSRLVVRVESGLFFANSDHVRERIEALRTPATRIVVLDAETSPFIDISAAEMLAQLAASLRRDGIELRIARDIGQFRDVIRSAVPEAFHHEVFRTIDEALDAPPEEKN